MNSILYLLILIALVQVVRLWQSVRPLSKKRHFQMKKEGTERMAWDMEFKIYKTKEIREEIRQEFDFMKSRIENFEKQIENFPADAKKEDLARIKDDLERAQLDRDRLEGQIKQLDMEINGAKPSDQYPDGVTGLHSQVDSLRELVSMLNSWIKKI